MKQLPKASSKSLLQKSENKLLLIAGSLLYFMYLLYIRGYPYATDH